MPTILFRFKQNPFTPDLENVSAIEKCQHYRGHVASFSEISDGGSLDYNGELLLCKYNLGGTNSRVGIAGQSEAIDLYNFGRLDIAFKITALSEYNDKHTTIAASRGGNEPTVISYTGGNDDNKLDFLPYILGGRNSEPFNGSNDIRYGAGLTDVDLISRAGAFRFQDYSSISSYRKGTFAAGMTVLDGLVASVISGGGWYSQFCHWNDFTLESYQLEDYFSHLAGELTGEDVYKGSYNSIVEYYFVKEAIDTVTANGDTVTIEYSKKYPGSPYGFITTPSWIKVDLTGTNYAGKDIMVSHGGKIRSVGSDVYYISIDLDFDETEVSFNIFITTTPSYINLNMPSVNRTGQSVTSDIPVKITLFNKLKSDELVYGDVNVSERQLTANTAFTLATTYDLVNRDYYLAYITSEGMSGVIQF